MYSRLLSRPSRRKAIPFERLRCRRQLVGHRPRGFVFDRLFLPLLLSHAYKDKDEAAIRASSLDWVIVHPTMLTNDPARGSVRAVTDFAGVNGGKMHAPMSLGSW